ncbi:MAG: hypothetical protein VX529_02655 [Pseudomonadota bacterium]|nr:hypothetical protein [Pseudomonadota bacterium]
MIDHTLDPLPKRAHRTDTGEHDGRMWFSRETMSRASHYADVSWLRIALPALTSLGLVAAGVLTAAGLPSALCLLAGLAGSAITLPAALLKATYAPRSR